MQRIGIIANLNKPQAKPVVRRLIAYLEKKQKTVFVEERLGECIHRQQNRVPLQALAKHSELIIVLGGDGTLLYAARNRALGSRPVLGINLGSLGFLANVAVTELEPTLELVLRKKYQLQPRMMLTAKIVQTEPEVQQISARKKKILSSVHPNTCFSAQSFLALNDIVITKEALARIIELTIYINEEFVARYQADGVIIATPTGTTAHSLSAGGPIVHPNQQAIVITPICPHTLSNRPLIISANDEISIAVHTPEQAVYLTLDGQEGIPLLAKQYVLVKKAKESVNLIMPVNKSYFEVLRTKLHWGGR
ncbi:MAG: NAD(+)/NADH kinase [bacterium]|nr:NAD(+)/NADH kinase [bacterium]